MMMSMMTGQNHNLSAGTEGENIAFLPSVPLFSELPKTGDKVFDRAIRVVFHHEGYYSNDPDDPGGATVWGWSLRSAMDVGDLDGDGFQDLDLNFDGHVNHEDILLLKDRPEKALEMFKKVFWDPYQYHRLEPEVAIKVFDLGVNMGSIQAHKLLQRSVRAVSDQRLIDDGILGRQSFKALNEIDTHHTLISLRAHAAGFYRLLVCRRPRSAKYLGGWLNRAYF